MGTVKLEQACNAFAEGKVSWETHCQSHLCNETVVNPTFSITSNFSFINVWCKFSDVLNL